ARNVEMTLMRAVIGLLFALAGCGRAPGMLLDGGAAADGGEVDAGEGGSGAIALDQSITSGGVESLAFADFYDVQFGECNSLAATGPCAVFVCPPSPPPGSWNVGTIVISTDDPALRMELNPEDRGHYFGAKRNGAMLSDGKSLHFSGVGL